MYKANKEDFERAKIILIEESEKLSSVVLDDELENLLVKILEINYSIGGSYEEKTIRKIVKAKLAEWRTS